jgi:4-amino-4-deoxy-L-arabinose transferase-like glycosyltransferase
VSSILLLLALVGAALILRALNLDWGFPEIYEEATPVRRAVGMWGDPGGAIDPNPHFFKYPSFTFYLNYLAQAVWYFALSLSGDIRSLNDFRQFLGEDPTRAVLLGRWLQAVLGALAVVPAVVFGRRLGGTAAGWIAGGLVAVLPIAVAESRMVGPDVALMLFTAAALASCTRLARGVTRSDALWAGLWIGLATASKYPGALLLVAYVTAFAVAARATGRGPLDAFLSSVFWQGGLVTLVAFAAASPYVLIDAATALEDIAFERRHMALGHLGREDGRALGYYLAHAIPAGWTWIVAALSVIGGIRLAVRGETRRSWLPGAVFAVVFLLVLGSWKMAAPRYALPLVPVAAAWAGAALAWTAVRVGPRARWTLTLLVAGAAMAWPLARSIDDVALHGRADSRLAAAAWIEANLEPGTSLLVERYGPEPDRERHPVLYMPFHGVTPHVYDPAYSPVLYSTFDAVVLSSGVNARYLDDPREYPAQVAFYAAIDRAFREVAVFPPGEYLGPEIRILVRDPEAPLRELSGIPAGFFDGLRGNRRVAEHFSALGTVLAEQGRLDLATIMLQAAVDMDAENAKVWGNLGAVQLGEGRLEDALLALRRARDLAPDDPKVAYNLATLYQRMGELRQAAESYERAIALDGAYETAYIGLARVLVEDDRYGRARLVLNEFLLRFPRSPRREQAETALRELARLGPGKP